MVFSSCVQQLKKEWQKLVLLRKKKTVLIFIFAKTVFENRKNCFFKNEYKLLFWKKLYKTAKRMFSNRKKKFSKTFFSKIKTETNFCLKKNLFFFKKLKKTVLCFFNRNWKQKCFQKPVFYRIKTEMTFCFKKLEKNAVSVLFKKGWKMIFLVIICLKNWKKYNFCFCLK